MNYYIMPGKIKFIKKKQTRKIDLKYSRTRPKMVMVRSNKIPVPKQFHTFKRMISNPGTLTGNVLHNPYLSNFYLNGINNVVNASEFGNLYDQYRILKCVWKAYLKIDPSAQAAGTASFPRLFYARDFDSSANPGSIDELRQYGRCKTVVMNPNRPVTVVFKPNTLQTLYNTAVTSTYKPTFNQWIDCSNLNTVHYGFPWAIDDLTNSNYQVTFEITVYFQCKNTR